MKKSVIVKSVDTLMGADESIHTVSLVWSVAAVSSNKISGCVRRHKRRVIRQAVSSVAPSVCQHNPLPVDIASVRDLGQLYSSFIYKSEKRSPVARDTKREETDKRRGKTFRMQKGIIGIFTQTFNKSCEFALLQLRKPASASLELRMKYYLKHFACVGVQLGTSLRLRSALLGRDLHRAMLDARIPDDTRLQGLFRQHLSQRSEASASLFLEKSCSYLNTIPTKRKINTKNGWTSAGRLRRPARVVILNSGVDTI